MDGFDAIVIGVGAMGSAACLELAKRGARVLGIDQFGVAHDRGSSHGQTRIIRKAYFEHPNYVPLLHRAYEMWADLETQSGQALFERCGLLLAGDPAGALIAGCRRAAAEHALALEDIPTGELSARWPGFEAGSGMEVLFEPDAGFLRVEDCVRALVERATAAEVRFEWNTPVLGWSADDESVIVRTGGRNFTASQLVICGGAWAGRLLPGLSTALEVRRKVLLWFRSSEPGHRLDHGCPVFGFDTDLGFIYGFPGDASGEIKIANHTGGEVVSDPSNPDQSLHDSDTRFAAGFFSRHMPGVSPRALRHAICMYTMTPDEHFVIDRMVEHPRVSFAAGFSGHGFKFAPIVGSILADFALEGRTSEPIGFLSASRPAISEATP
jgi:monomeric sarcosine oxidase